MAGDPPVTTKLLLLSVMRMAPESTSQRSTCSLCQWRPDVHVELTGIVMSVLKGSLKERRLASGGGNAKVDRWVVRVRVAMVVGGSR